MPKHLELAPSVVLVVPYITKFLLCHFFKDRQGNQPSHLVFAVVSNNLILIESILNWQYVIKIYKNYGVFVTYRVENRIF